MFFVCVCFFVRSIFFFFFHFLFLRYFYRYLYGCTCEQRNLINTDNYQFTFCILKPFTCPLIYHSSALEFATFPGPNWLGFVTNSRCFCPRHAAGFTLQAGNPGYAYVAGANDGEGRGDSPPPPPPLRVSCAYQHRLIRYTNKANVQNFSTRLSLRWPNCLTNTGIRFHSPLMQHNSPG